MSNNQSIVKTVGLAAAACALAGAIVALPPIADAGPDGGLCVLNNGVPFYIPAGGYTHGPEEVITGPVTKPPCNTPAPSSSNPPSLSTPSLPGLPTSTSSSTSPSPAPEPPPEG